MPQLVVILLWTAVAVLLTAGEMFLTAVNRVEVTSNVVIPALVYLSVVVVKVRLIVISCC